MAYWGRRLRSLNVVKCKGWSREDQMYKSKGKGWLCALSASVMLLVWMSVAGAQEVPKFEVDPFWPKPLPNNWALGQVGGIAVDERDHVWIIHRPDSLTPAEKAA